MGINQNARENIIPPKRKLPYMSPKIMVQQVELENPIMIASVHPKGINNQNVQETWNEGGSDASANYWQPGSNYWQ